MIPKVLVVDDDAATRNLLWSLLSMAGYEVILAEDGKSAIDMTQRERPDLVLADGLLPKMHGFLVCKTINSFPNPPRVLILTGVYSKPTYGWQVNCEYGADALMNKPFDAGALLLWVAQERSSASSSSAAA
jgi:DNA-binding response OmpR family regulator